MNKQLYIADIRHQLTFDEMVARVERVDHKMIYYYNQNYICGKTVQYEIFNGIWIVCHDVVLQNPELFPMHEPGFIRMNYCISGRCEFDYQNRKVLYTGAGDFVASLLDHEHHKHNFPLGNYNGISIITTDKELDVFLKTIFIGTQMTSDLLVSKMKTYDKYLLFANDSRVQAIMKAMIEPDNIFWKEKAILKFAELILLLIDDDQEATKEKGRYFDKRLTDKVKQIKKEVTENSEFYLPIAEIAQKYNVSSRTFLECFKEIYGKTYYAFIKEYRIKKAAEMLGRTNKTIGEIAITVGYQNASKFSKAFADIMGVTPLHFRKYN
jgi:AraC-like DNA-binding protein